MIPRKYAHSVSFNAADTQKTFLPMKLLATVIAVAAARKNSCSNTPPVGTIILGHDENYNYAVTAEDVANWSACGPNADCTKIRGWNFECVCKEGFIDYAPEDYRKGSCFDSCFTAVIPDHSTCDVDADGNAFWTCDDGYYQSSVEIEGSGSGDAEFEDVCFFDSCATDPCADNADCTADGDSHVCSCSAGFFDFNGDASLCVPDNCAAGTGGCDADATCSVDLPDEDGNGQNSCTCNAGFYGDGEECFVDSCALSPCQDDATCANVGDDFTCTCNEGFYLGYAPYEGSGEGSTWDDPAACHVDVCDSANPCDADAACTNNADGSTSCACNAGFYGDGYECFVDSCALSPCQDNSACENIGDDYTCTCNFGYYLGFAPYEGSGEGSTWENPDACHVDVCASANPCDVDAACFNNPDGSQSCACNDGFYGDGYECFVDSCALSPCQDDATCANVGDEYTCTCNDGFYLGYAPYEGSGEGSTWDDPAACHIDVCASANPCDADAACSNNDDGSQSCSCNDGFYGDGYECFVDSCALSPCQADSTCANTGDSYTCTCNEGFYLGEDSEGDDACHVDVCDSANPCDVDATCSNEIDGSQSCVCNDGFYGDGDECFFDSCATSPCQVDSTCTNEGDSFSCTCNAGFYEGTTTVEGSTGDLRDEVACHVDVCASESNPCDSNASCDNNADGSQTCTCNFDFKGDGVTCTDIGLLNQAEIQDRLAAFDSDAAGIDNSKVAKKFNKALKKYPMKHVDNYVSECMNKREANAIIEAAEADDISGQEEELLGWDISDACSYAKDLATANNRFLKRWACVEQWGFNVGAKDLKKENKNLRKKMKKSEKQLKQFTSKVNAALGC
ncbi:Oidioi.mRNA.OKI2018_I69.chr2.g4626.t1.cds [Oikopleura dioica]|uniref:Oidioi.mRNA.OKI2018_I69.chr2.g4626.t1.cds n=1 Tax=Oikopleura dioica TaxID=34765 RepID=A0ABN7SY08_OIKDI|nr:Oidioi.mRNA.OKI2018_I69.chr2.g4626.t1.cds [Oikopleura dioica]